MDYRSIRQLILILIPLTIIAVAGFFVYFRYFGTPTCFDNSQNQGEEGVDCGGPCQSCAFKQKKNIDYYFSDFIEVLPRKYDVVAKVKNPNTELTAKEFRYEVVLRDTAGVIMQKKEGKSYLYSGETVYIIETSIFSQKTIGSVEFKIKQDETNWVAQTLVQPDIISGEKDVQTIIREDNTTSTRLTLKILNRSINDYKNIEVSVLLLDENQNIFAVNRTVIDSLAAGESAPLIFAWPGELKIDTSRIIVQPRVNFLRY